MTDEAPKPIDHDKPKAAKPRATRRCIAIGFVVAVPIALAIAFLGIKTRCWKAPYPPLGKRICWALGCAEEAYNFEVVVPGRVYRSGLPDERFYRYLHAEYGLRQVVSLSGPGQAPAPPAALGIRHTVLCWGASKPPPRADLEQVLAALHSGQPVLVHCAGGSDRTGYAIAAYRILRQGWAPEQAFAEMNRYWHDPEGKPLLQADLRRLAARR